MPATLRTLKGLVIQLPVYLGDPEKSEEDRTPDDFIDVWYRQHSYTAASEKLARESELAGTPSQGLAELCAAAFVKWTLKLGATEEQAEALDAAHAAGDAKKVQAVEAEIQKTIDEQEPIPITTANLMEHVPTSILMEILKAIGESRSPEANGTAPQ